MGKSKTDVLEEMSKFIFASKYSRYDEKKQRRESWSEAVLRVRDMHLKRFSFLPEEDLNEIKEAFRLVDEKYILPSMRSMQFGGKAVEAKHLRMFNCCVRHIDSLRSFSEIFFALLCGTGVGIGLSKKFLDRLPDFVGPNDKTGSVINYSVEDTIEGWADSVEALLMCYFKNTAMSGRKMVFDYSKLRPKGARLKTGGGKAPGYKGLKNAHQKIKKLLDFVIEEKKQARIKSVNVYDILMHCADAVLSGGVRRSATSVVFQPDDHEMTDAKTAQKVEHVYAFHKIENDKYEGRIKFNGEKMDVVLSEYEIKNLKENNLIGWHHVHPQRARSNNSVLIQRNKVTYDEFRAFFDKTVQFGEPGFVFGDHEDQLFNPCQPKWASVLTKNGISTIGNVNIGDEIWSETGWTKIVNKWSTGVKRVFKYSTTAGFFYGTENHKLVSNGAKVDAKDCETIDRLTGEYSSAVTIDPQDVMDGLVIGDGTVHKASGNLVLLCIGSNDSDYFSSEVKDLIIKHRPGVGDTQHEIQTTITDQELPKTFDRFIPDRFYYGNRNTVCGFLRGLFTANGSLCGSRVTLKWSSRKGTEQVVEMLSSIGIRSYMTFNEGKSVKFSNGSYLCKDSYSVNITTDRDKYNQLIGFLQDYKNESLAGILEKTGKTSKSKNSYDVISSDFISEEEVFDITVDNKTHTYWTGGLNVSNCFEIAMLPVTEDGVCGIQMCNLSTINGSKMTSKEIFKKAAKYATIIGTLQASYTDFPHLGHASEKLTREEALLGVSVTGMMEDPNILLNNETQAETAKYVCETNEDWANKILIKPAARITCVKPEGTSSLILKCSSGIHPHHAKKYFRRVQCNKLDPVYKFFKKHNPTMCEESVWSENKTDDVVTFPVTVSENSMVKSDLTAEAHLEIIKNTQKNWVANGTTKHNKKPLTHNVSCTVVVKDDEWDMVAKYLFENKEYFCAVSLLPFIGDKLYRQAPNEAVSTEEDSVKFDELTKLLIPIDYTELKEADDETLLQQEGSCYGGKCETVQV